jgi:hypothetical protein
MVTRVAGNDEGYCKAARAIVMAMVLRVVGDKKNESRKAIAKALRVAGKQLQWQ